jgi:hypothetical protein
VAVPPAAPPPPAFQRADIPVPPPESPARSQDALSESRVVTAPAERSTRDTDERLELEEVQVTGSRVQREPRRTVGPRGTVPAPENDAPSPLVVQGFVANASLPENLLRQHFPAQYQSDTSHRLWIAREADGSMVRSGELAPGLRLEDALPGIGQALGGRRVTRESVHALMNARGQAIELNLLLVR